MQEVDGEYILAAAVVVIAAHVSPRIFARDSVKRDGKFMDLISH